MPWSTLVLPGWVGLGTGVVEAKLESFLLCLSMFPKRHENYGFRVFLGSRRCAKTMFSCLFGPGWLFVCLWPGGVGWGGWGWVGGLGSFGVGFGLGWFGVGLGRCGVVRGLANMRLNPTSWKGCVAR